MEFPSNWNVTQIGFPLKLKCHSNINVTQIGRLNLLKKVVNPKTSKSASIGRISILFYIILIWDGLLIKMSINFQSRDNFVFRHA